nr:MAG TPA: hypothetical protein [Caudoviricetes sp.]
MKTLHLVVSSTYRNKKIINLIPGSNYSLGYVRTYDSSNKLR